MKYLFPISLLACAIGCASHNATFNDSVLIGSINRDDLVSERAIQRAFAEHKVPVFIECSVSCGVSVVKQDEKAGRALLRDVAQFPGVWITLTAETNASNDARP